MTRRRVFRGTGTPAGSTAGVLLSGLVALGLGACDAVGDGAGVLYATSGLGDEVVRLDAGDGRILSRIPVDRTPFETDEPHGIAFAPDGRYWYATLMHGAPSLWKFETRGDRLVGRLTLRAGGAARIGITPDGERAFVPDYDRTEGRTGRVAVIRLRDLAPIASVPLCAAPHDAEVSPAGDRVAVTCSGGTEIAVLDAAEPTRPAKRWSIGPGPDGAAPHPLNVAWAPDGQRVYVTLHGAAAVAVLDATTGKELRRVSVGAGPAQLALSRDGRTLVTANRADGSLSIVSTAGWNERRVPLGVTHPHGVALNARGSMAYVTWEGGGDLAGGVVAVSLEEGAVAWRSAAGRYLLGVVWRPD